MKSTDYERINQYVKEFLRFNKYMSTLECFEAEERTKLVTSKNKQMNIHPDVRLNTLLCFQDTQSLETFPRLYRFFETDSSSAGREKASEKRFTALENKFNHTMIAAR